MHPWSSSSASGQGLFQSPKFPATQIFMARASPDFTSKLLLAFFLLELNFFGMQGVLGKGGKSRTNLLLCST